MSSAVCASSSAGTNEEWPELLREEDCLEEDLASDGTAVEAPPAPPIPSRNLERLRPAEAPRSARRGATVAPASPASSVLPPACAALEGMPAIASTNASPCFSGGSSTPLSTAASSIPRANSVAEAKAAFNKGSPPKEDMEANQASFSATTELGLGAAVEPVEREGDSEVDRAAEGAVFGAAVAGVAAGTAAALAVAGAVEAAAAAAAAAARFASRFSVTEDMRLALRSCCAWEGGSGEAAAASSPSSAAGVTRVKSPATGEPEAAAAPFVGGC